MCHTLPLTFALWRNSVVRLGGMACVGLGRKIEVSFESHVSGVCVFRAFEEIFNVVCFRHGLCKSLEHRGTGEAGMARLNL